MVWSFGPLLSQEQSLDSHLLMAAWPKSCTCKDTWPQLWKELAWSFKALAKGQYESKCQELKDRLMKSLNKGKLGPRLEAGTSLEKGTAASSSNAAPLEKGASSSNAAPLEKGEKTS